MSDLVFDGPHPKVVSGMAGKLYCHDGNHTGHKEDQHECPELERRHDPVAQKRKGKGLYVVYAKGYHHKQHQDGKHDSQILHGIPILPHK
jgi:hypothetical protein